MSISFNKPISCSPWYLDIPSFNLNTICINTIKSYTSLFLFLNIYYDFRQESIAKTIANSQ